ncbi:DUF5985 family protein [Novosphingobium sp. G106]|uniref:DUF5985 family protein n=1 Tax=Novosphingobium sp. G106 TaxID=2849500 RepID=UPI0020C4D391|nr:DUF5985 family protein [Novosphingobium sp. G106]
MLLDFLGGAVSMGFAVAGLILLSFWRKSRVQLFLAFAGSFFLLAINQTLLTLSNVPLEERSWLYLLRLAAFLLIIFAIIRHNARDDRQR